jgi:two-component system response regulator RegA
MREKGNTRGRTVLVVDDDETLLRAYAGAARHGVRVITAATRDEARSLAREHLPEVAIIDLQLGAESGIDAIRDVRTANPEAHIVLISGYGSIESTVAAMRAGAHDVVEKPVTLAEILRRVGGGKIVERHADPLSLERAQWEHVQRVLADCGQNKSKAARVLGIPRSRLRRLLARPAPRR